MKYFLTFIAIIIGALIVIKTEWILQNIGYNEWAETKFRSFGGSRAYYKLIGVVIILVALMYITGMIEGILSAVFNPSIGR